MSFPKDVEKFPVLQVLKELTDAIALNPITLLQAPPGAGKSTVLPLHLLNQNFLNHKKIIIIEPRRLAAKAVAARLADGLVIDIIVSVAFRGHHLGPIRLRKSA